MKNVLAILALLPVTLFMGMVVALAAQKALRVLPTISFNDWLNAIGILIVVGLVFGLAYWGINILAEPRKRL